MDFSKHVDKFSVKINGIPLGQVIYYRATKTFQIDENSPCYTVEIKRRIPNTPRRELFDFHTQDTFNTTFVRAGSEISYVDCIVDKVTEEIGDDRLIYEAVIISAPLRVIDDE